MRKYIYIGLGGALGASLRYLIKEISINKYQQTIPIDTLLINIVGCFLLAFILTVALDVLRRRPNLKLGITIGFLGAFTTFSTICKEIVDLASNGHYLIAVFYFTASTVFGLMAAYLGFISAKKIFIEKSSLPIDILTDIESEME